MSEASTVPVTESVPLDPHLLLQQIGYNALNGERSPDEQPVIPRGWTTLIHGTDTERWQVGDSSKTIKGINGLSMITTEMAAKLKEDALRVGNPGAYNTTGGYAQSDSAAPVEVRVPFYREDLKANRIPAADVADIKAGLSPDKVALITRYHQDRHPVIPRGQVLVRLGDRFVDQDTGRIVEYFVPESVLGDYVAAVLAEEPPAE